MPDFEHLTRSLEHHIAATPEEKAFVRGKHAGEDVACWQVIKIVAVVTVAVIALNYFR